MNYQLTKGELKMKALITKQSVYGATKYYPACEISETLAEIAGTKTLTEQTIKSAKKIGITFEIVFDHSLHI